MGHDYSIIHYYRAVAEVIGFKGKFEFDLSKPVGMKQKLVDITELKNLGWNHKISLTDGINEAYEFFIKNSNYGI